MSDVQVTDIEQLKEEVSDLTGPLLNKYSGLDTEIKKREKKIEEIKEESRRKVETIRAEIKSLRDSRTYLRTIVRNIDPSLIPSQRNGKKPGPKSSKNGGKKKIGYSVETVQAIQVYLQTRKDELNNIHGDASGFRPIDIYTREGFPLKSESAVNKVLADMHEGGVLHLDRWVRGRPHGDVKTGKFYKVV
jgi:hypothetical protein